MIKLYKINDNDDDNYPPPPLRSSHLSQGDSKLLLAMLTQDGTTKVMPSLFYILSEGVSSVSSVLSPFSSYIILALMNITRNDMFHIKRRHSLL